MTSAANAAGAGVPSPCTSVPSPCTSVCTMNATTGWCAGCYRTLDEIAAWSVLDDDEKRALLDVLARRRAADAASAVPIGLSRIGADGQR